MRPCRKVEAALVCDMRVGDERDIRDSEVASGKPSTSGELALHKIERFLAAFHAPCLAGLPRLSLIKHVRAANGNVRLLAVARRDITVNPELADRGHGHPPGQIAADP